ncbi:MAG: hypothetical protein DMG63_04100 [Acidobacteria bacterium]|nr:MAG: hypothetical protein DMG63_04100 [Acidobacteriota bacterium]
MGGFGTTEHTIFLRLGVVEDFQNARDGALDSGSIELLALFVEVSKARRSSSGRASDHSSAVRRERYPVTRRMEAAQR